MPSGIARYSDGNFYLSSLFSCRLEKLSPTGLALLGWRTGLFPAGLVVDAQNRAYALDFVLAAILDKFRHLRTSLVFRLAYVGMKMIASHHVEIPTLLSLWIIALILAGGVAASLVADQGNRGRDESPLVRERRAGSGHEA